MYKHILRNSINKWAQRQTPSYTTPTLFTNYKPPTPSFYSRTCVVDKIRPETPNPERVFRILHENYAKTPSSRYNPLQRSTLSGAHNSPRALIIINGTVLLIVVVCVCVGLGEHSLQLFGHSFFIASEAT